MQDGSLRSGTGAVFQLWVRRVKLDRLARQQINHIDRDYPVGMGSDIPVIQYMGVSYTKLSFLFGSNGNSSGWGIGQRHLFPGCSPDNRPS